MRIRVVLPLVVALVAGPAAAGARAGDPVWTPTFAVQGGHSRLAALPDGTVWGVIDHNRVVRSADAGRTWGVVNPVPVQGFGLPMTGPQQSGSTETLVAPVSADVALGANGPALSLTRDAGLTWSPLRQPHVTKSESFEHSDQLERTGGAYWYARGGSELRGLCPYPIKTTPLLTSLDGTRWRRTDIPFPAGMVQEVRFVDSRRGAALVLEFRYSETQLSGEECGYSGTATTSALFVTDDAGRSWRRAMRCAPVCYGLSWSSPGRLVVGRADGRVDMSKDGGRAFRQLAPVPAAAAGGFLQALDCVGPRCWAAVNGAGVFRLDGGGEWVQELSTQTAFGLGIGDLAAVDRERAVTGGPNALSTRVVSPGVHRAVPPAGPVGGLREIAVAPGITVDAQGTWHRRVSLSSP